MASIDRRGNRWRVQVRKRGVSKAGYFSTKKEARAWADTTEKNLSSEPIHRLLLATALKRYQNTVTPTKKGASVEAYRIGAWIRHPLSSRPMHEIKSADLATWRDEQEAAPTTIKNSLTVLSQVYKIAATEWGHEGLINPVAGLRMPRNNPPRDRRLEGDEEERLLAVCVPWMKEAITWAIETGFRRSEQLSVLRSDVNGRVVHLPKTKNGKARTVPLSKRALSLLPSLPQEGRLFPYSVHQLRDHWLDACEKAEVEGLRWHDLRATCVSRLLEKGIGPFQVAQISGHSSMSIMQRYARFNAEELANLLD